MPPKAGQAVKPKGTRITIAEAKAAEATEAAAPPSAEFDMSFLKRDLPASGEGIHVIKPSLIQPHLDNDTWTTKSGQKPPKKGKKSGKQPIAAAGRAAGVLVQDVEKEIAATVAASESGLLSGTVSTTKPVIFQGKVYQIPVNKSPQEAFHQAGVSANARRKARLKFDDSDVVVNPRTLAVATATGLTHKHMKQLRAQYAEIDFSGMGDITYDEFFDFVDHERSIFTDIVWDRVVGKSGSQKLQFDDFVVICVTYCMYSKRDLLRLLFQIFDQDGSNIIDDHEWIDMCRCVNNGKPLFPGGFEKAMQLVDADGDGAISFEEFVRMNDKFPMVLYPAFLLQAKIQENTLGSRVWVQLAEKLVRLRREREERLAREGATAHPGVAKLKNVNKQGSGGILRRFLRALSCYSCRHPGISNADVDYATAEEALLRFDRTQRLVAEGKSAQSSSNVMPSAQVPASSAGQSDQLTEELKRSSIVTIDSSVITAAVCGGSVVGELDAASHHSDHTPAAADERRSAFRGKKMSASHIAHGGAGGRHVRNSSPLASGNAAADAQPFVIGHTVPSVVLTGALSPSAIGQAFHLKSYTGPDPKRRGPVKAGHATQV